MGGAAEDRRERDDSNVKRIVTQMMPGFPDPVKPQPRLTVIKGIPWRIVIQIA
ncbi:hypothetical protein D3C73_1477960 [compost metagenome]